MTDPTVGSITATEVAKLSAAFQAVMARHQALGSVLIQAELLHQASGAELSAFRQAFIEAIVTDPIQEPPVVEPEPPIVEPPTGDYGAPGPWPTVLDIGKFGGTPGDKAMHAWADNGGNLLDAEIIGGQGAAVSNFNESVGLSMYGKNLLVRASPSFGTDWLYQLHNRDTEMERCTFTAEGTPFHKEGHGRYVRPYRRFISRGCLNRKLYGNPIQLAYRPGAEAGGPVEFVYIDDRFEHVHAPVDAAGNRSDRAGPVIALYGLGPACVYQIIQDQLQDLFPQMGPSVTAVPEGAKDPATGQMLPPWWTPDQWTDLSIDVETRGKILSPVHQELYRIAGIRTVDLKADITIVDGGTPRILIDPLAGDGSFLYKAKPAEAVRVAVTARRPDGSKLALPVEWKGQKIGTTADGVLTGGAVIGGH